MGRNKKEFCVKGHKMSETRIINGTNYVCGECRKLNSVKSNSKRVCDPFKNKKRNIKRLYGLDWVDYLALEGKYEKCPICQASFYEKFSCVDHDKQTGKVRGLLCHNCNTGIGLLKHSKDNLIRALKYLETEK